MSLAILPRPPPPRKPARLSGRSSRPPLGASGRCICSRGRACWLLRPEAEVLALPQRLALEGQNKASLRPGGGNGMTCSLCFSKACVPARRLPCSPVRVESRAKNRQTKGLKGMGVGWGENIPPSQRPRYSRRIPSLYSTPLPLPPYAVLPSPQDREMTTASVGHCASKVATLAFTGLGSLSPPSCGDARGPWQGQLSPVCPYLKAGALSGFSVSSCSECSWLPTAGVTVTHWTGEAETQSNWVDAAALTWESQSDPTGCTLAC